MAISYINAMNNAFPHLTEFSLKLSYFIINYEVKFDPDILLKNTTKMKLACST